MSNKSDENNRLEALERGCVLLGTSSRSSIHRLYLLKCGHQKEVTVQNMRKGSFRCLLCQRPKHLQEAINNGCRLLKNSNLGHDYRVYELPCGHKKDITLFSMRKGNFTCNTCIDEKLIVEAEESNCKLICESKKGCYYRLYELPCGHIQDIQMTHMRNGQFRCHICEDSPWDKPSLFYTIKLIDKDTGFSWVKNGICSDIQNRIRGYGLIGTVDYEVLYKTELFKDRFESIKHESLLKEYNKEYKLDKHICKTFMRFSGFNECYDTCIIEDSINHSKNLLL